MEPEYAGRLRELQRQRNDAEDRCVMQAGVIAKLVAENEELKKDKDVKVVES